MVIANPANLHTGIDSGGSVTNFTSPTLNIVTAGMAADGCVLLHLFGQDTSAAYPTGISSPAGLGLTWRVAQFQIQSTGATRWFDALIVGTKQSGDTGPTNGTFTCTIASSSATRLGFEAALINSGVDVASMASWPVGGAQSASAAGLTPTVASADAAGIIFTTAGHRVNEGQSLEAGWTELADFGHATPDYDMSMGYRAGNGDLSAGWTWATAQTCAACIVAITGSAAAPIPSRWAVSRLALTLDQRPVVVKGTNVYAVQPYVGATGTDETGLYAWFADATNRVNFARHLKYYGFNAIRLPVMNDVTHAYFDKVGAIGAALWLEGIATLVCPFDGQAQSVGGFGDNWPDDTVGGTNSAAVACGDWLAAAWLYLASPDWFLFDTYNEPNQGGSLTDANWLSGMETLITHARASGYSGPIFAEGNGYAHDFPTNVATLLTFDPQVILQCHRYATNDGSSQPSLDGSDAYTWKAAWPDTAAPIGAAIVIGEFGPFNNGYGNNGLAFVQTIGTLTDNVDRSSYTLVTTNNVTAGNVAVLVVEGHHASTVVQPSISGHGLTWTPAGRLGSTIALDVFYGTGTPDGTDITINFGSTHIGCIANCFEISGADTSTVIEQIAFATGGATTGPVSLPRPPKSGLVVSAVGHQANELANSGTGWTAISDSNFASPNAGLQTERQAANDQSYDPSWTTSSAWISMIAEIRESGGGPSFENNVNNWCRAMAGTIELAVRRGQCVGSFAWTLLWDDDASFPANSLWLNNSTEIAAFNAGTNIPVRNLWGELVYGMYVETRIRRYDIYRARSTTAIVSAVAAFLGVSMADAAAFVTVSVIGSLVGVSDQATAASRTVVAQAVAAAVSAEADAGIVQVVAPAALVGVSAADEAATRTVVAPAVLVGVSDEAVDASRTVVAQSSAVGVSLADDAAIMVVPHTAALVGVSLEDAAATRTVVAPVSLVGVSDEAVDATRTVVAQTPMVGVSAADDAAIIVVAAQSAAVGVSAEADAGIVVVQAPVSAVGVSAEAVAPSRVVVAQAPLVGVSDADAAATATTAAVVSAVGVSAEDGAPLVVEVAAAALVGVSAEDVVATRTVIGQAPLVGVSAGDAGASLTTAAIVALVGISEGELSTAAIQLITGVLVGVSDADADASRTVVGQVTLVGMSAADMLTSAITTAAVGSLPGVSAEDGAGIVVVNGLSSLAGVSAADAAAARIVVGQVAFPGVSLLDGAANAAVIVTASFVGVSAADEAALVQRIAQATFAGVSAETDVVTRTVVAAAAFPAVSGQADAALATTAATGVLVGVSEGELSTAAIQQIAGQLVGVSAAQSGTTASVVAAAALAGVSAEAAQARATVAAQAAAVGVSSADAGAAVVVQSVAALVGVGAFDEQALVQVVARAAAVALSEAELGTVVPQSITVAFVDASDMSVRVTVGLVGTQACVAGSLSPASGSGGLLVPATAGSGGLVPATASDGGLEECP